MKKVVLFATLVAISIRWTHGQELTWEQLAAEQYRALELQLMEKAQLDLIAAREASMTLEDKQDLLIKAIANKISPPPSPPPPNPVIAGIRRIEAARTSSGTLALTSLSSTSVGGGSQPQALMSSGGGGITINSLNLDPYTPYGIAPINQWGNASTYPWDVIPRTLITGNASNNIAMASYGLVMPTGFGSTITSPILTNHYDIGGRPRWHVMKFWYQNDIINIAGGDKFFLSFANVNNPNGVGSTNLPFSSAWRQVEVLIPPFAVPLNMYFVQLRGANTSTTPKSRIDNSVRYYPYEPEWAGLRYTKTNNSIELRWDIWHQWSNYWKLEFAQNVLGPWATNTAPYSVSGNIATLSFPTTNSSRYYRLIPK